MNFLKTSVLITKKVPESGTPSKYVSHTIPKPHTKFHALDQPVTIFPTYSLAITKFRSYGLIEVVASHDMDLELAVS